MKILSSNFNHLIPTACRPVVLIMSAVVGSSKSKINETSILHFLADPPFFVSFGFDLILIIPFGFCVGVAAKMPSREEFLTITTASFVRRYFLDLR
jgi:hypothetical protein